MMPDESTLDEEVILRTASRLAGDRVRQDVEVLPALRVLLAALRLEADLDEGGRRNAAAHLVSCLVTRAAVAAAVARDPSIHDEPLFKPVFITGLLRTGTTLLHNLFGANSACRVLRRWEMQSPVRPLDAGVHWEEGQLRAALQRVNLIHHQLPALLDIHPLDPSAPDECNLLFCHSLASAVFTWKYRVPSYRAWLHATDMTVAYRHYRLQLQLLTRSSHRVLVLKDPAHLWHLKVLLEVFPDARVIRLHRPAEEVVPSYCSLLGVLRSQNGMPVDRHALGMECLAHVKLDQQRADQAESLFEPGTFIHQNYHELVADPLGTVQVLHEKLQIPFGMEAETRVREWMAAYPTHARHRYDLAQFGLEKADLADLNG